MGNREEETTSSRGVAGAQVLWIVSDPEIAFSCNGNFDLVSFFEVESFDDGSGKAYGQAVSPFRNLHNASVDIRSW